MQITIDFDNGQRTTLKPEHLHLVDGGTETILGINVGGTVVPVVFFKTLLATKAEVDARPKPDAQTQTPPTPSAS